MDLRVFGLIVISYNVAFGQREFTMETMFGEVPTPLLAMAAQDRTGMAADTTGGIAIGGMENQLANPGQTFASGGNIQLFGASGPIGRQVQSNTASKAVVTSSAGVGLNTKAGSGEFVNEAFTALGNVGHLVKVQKEPAKDTVTATGIDATDASRYPTFGASVDSITSYTNAENAAPSFQNTASLALPTIENMPANASALYFYKMLARNVLNGQNAMTSPSLNAILSAIVSRNLKPGTEMNAGLLFLRNALLGSSGDMNSANLTGLRSALKRIASNAAILQNASEMASFSSNSKLAGQQPTVSTSDSNSNFQDSSIRYKLPSFTPLGSIGTLHIDTSMLKSPFDTNKHPSNENTAVNMDTASISMTNYNDKLPTADFSAQYDMLTSKQTNPIENGIQFDIFSGNSDSLSNSKTISDKTISVENNKSGANSTLVPISSNVLGVMETKAITSSPLLDIGLNLDRHTSTNIDDTASISITNPINHNTISTFDKPTPFETTGTLKANAIDSLAPTDTSRSIMTFHDSSKLVDVGSKSAQTDGSSVALTGETVMHNSLGTGGTGTAIKQDTGITMNDAPSLSLADSNAGIQSIAERFPYRWIDNTETNVKVNAAALSDNKDFTKSTSNPGNTASKSFVNSNVDVPGTIESNLNSFASSSQASDMVITKPQAVLSEKEGMQNNVNMASMATISSANIDQAKAINNKPDSQNVLDAAIANSIEISTNAVIPKENPMPQLDSKFVRSSSISELNELINRDSYLTNQSTPYQSMGDSVLDKVIPSTPLVATSELATMNNDTKLAGTASMLVGKIDPSVDLTGQLTSDMSGTETANTMAVPYVDSIGMKDVMHATNAVTSTDPLTPNAHTHSAIGSSNTFGLESSATLGAVDGINSMQSNILITRKHSDLKDNKHLSSLHDKPISDSSTKHTMSPFLRNFDNFNANVNMHDTNYISLQQNTNSLDPITDTVGMSTKLNNHLHGMNTIRNEVNEHGSKGTILTHAEVGDVTLSSGKAPTTAQPALHIQESFPTTTRDRDFNNRRFGFAGFASFSSQADTIPSPIESPADFTATSTSSMASGSPLDTFIFQSLPTDTDKKISADKSITDTKTNRQHAMSSNVASSGVSDTISIPIEPPKDFTVAPTSSMTSGSSLDSFTFNSLPIVTDKKPGVEKSSIDSNINRLHTASSGVLSGFSDTVSPPIEPGTDFIAAPTNSMASGSSFDTFTFKDNKVGVDRSNVNRLQALSSSVASSGFSDAIQPANEAQTSFTNTPKSSMDFGTSFDTFTFKSLPSVTDKTPGVDKSSIDGNSNMLHVSSSGVLSGFSDTISPPIEPGTDFIAAPTSSIASGSSFDTFTFKDMNFGVDKSSIDNNAKTLETFSSNVASSRFPDSIQPAIEAQTSFTNTPKASIDLGSSFDTFTFKSLPTVTDKTPGVEKSSIDSNSNRLHVSSGVWSGFSDTISPPIELGTDFVATPTSSMASGSSFDTFKDMNFGVDKSSIDSNAKTLDTFSSNVASSGFSDTFQPAIEAQTSFTNTPKSSIDFGSSFDTFTFKSLPTVNDKKPGVEKSSIDSERNKLHVSSSGVLSGFSDTISPPIEPGTDFVATPTNSMASGSSFETFAFKDKNVGVDRSSIDSNVKTLDAFSSNVASSGFSDTIQPAIEAQTSFTNTPKSSMDFGSSFDTFTFKSPPTGTDKKVGVDTINSDSNINRLRALSSSIASSDFSSTNPPSIDLGTDFIATPTSSMTSGSSIDTFTFRTLPTDTNKNVDLDRSSIDQNINRLHTFSPNVATSEFLDTVPPPSQLSTDTFTFRSSPTDINNNNGANRNSIDSSINRLHASSSSVASSGFSNVGVGEISQGTSFNTDSSTLSGRPLETAMRTSDNQQIHGSTLNSPTSLLSDQTSLYPDGAGHAHLHVQDSSARGIFSFDAVPTGSNKGVTERITTFGDASKLQDKRTTSSETQLSEGQPIVALISDSHASTMDTHTDLNTPKNGAIPILMREFGAGQSELHNLPSEKTSFATMDSFPNQNTPAFDQVPVKSTVISTSNEQPVPTSIGHTDVPQNEVPLKPFKETTISQNEFNVPNSAKSSVFLNNANKLVSKDAPNTASKVSIDAGQLVTSEQTAPGNEFSFTQSSRRIPFEDLGVSNNFHLPHGSFVIGAGRPNSKVINTGLGLDPFTDSSSFIDSQPTADVPTDTKKQPSTAPTLPGWHITDASKIKSSTISTDNTVSDMPATPVSQPFDSVHIESISNSLGAGDSITKPVTVYDIQRNVENYYIDDSMHANTQKSKTARSDIDLSSYRDMHVDPINSMAHVDKGQDGVIETPYSTFTVVPKIAGIFVSEPEVVPVISGSGGAPITNLMGARVADTVSMKVDPVGAEIAVNSVKSSALETQGMSTNEAIGVAGENKGSIITKTSFEAAAISNTADSHKNAQSKTNKETTSTGGGIAISFGNMGGMGINGHLSSVAFSTSPSSTTHDAKSSSTTATQSTNLPTTTSEASTVSSGDRSPASTQTSTVDRTTQSVFTTTNNAGVQTTTEMSNTSAQSDNVTPSPTPTVAAINVRDSNLINKQAIATNTNNFATNVALQYLVPAANSISASKSFYNSRPGVGKKTVISKTSFNDADKQTVLSGSSVNAQLGAEKQTVIDIRSGWRPKSMSSNFLGFTVSPNRDAPGIPSAITDHSKVIDLKANSADVRSSFTSSETTVQRGDSTANGQVVRTPIVGNVFGSTSTAQSASLAPDQIVLSREPEVDFMTSFLSGVSSSASRPEFTVGKSVQIIPLGQTRVAENKALTNSAPESTSSVDKFGVAEIYTRQQQLNPEQWSQFMLSQNDRLNSGEPVSQNRNNAGGIKVQNIDYLTQNVVGASDVRSFADQNLMGKQQSDLSQAAAGTSNQMKMTSSQWSDSASGLTSATSSSGTNAIEDPLRKLQELQAEHMRAMKAQGDQTGQVEVRTAFEAPSMENPRLAMFGNDQNLSGTRTTDAGMTGSKGLNIVTSTQTKRTLSGTGQPVLFQGSSVTGSLGSTVPAYDTVSRGSSNNLQNAANFKVQTSEFTTTNQNIGTNRITVPGATEQMNWETIKRLIGQGKITLQMNADQTSSARIVPITSNQDIQDASRRNVNSFNRAVVTSTNIGQTDSANAINNQDRTGDSGFSTFTAAALTVGQPTVTSSETFTTSNVDAAIGGSGAGSQSNRQTVTNSQTFDASNTMGTSGTDVTINQANVQSVIDSGAFDASRTNTNSVGSFDDNTRSAIISGTFGSSRTGQGSSGTVTGSQANMQTGINNGAFGASRTGAVFGRSTGGSQSNMQTVIDSGAFDASKTLEALRGAVTGSQANRQTTGGQSAITTFRTGFSGTQSGIRNIDFSSQAGGKATQFTSGNRPAFFGSSVHGSGRALASGQQTSTTHRVVDASIIHECRYTSDPNNENYFYMTIGDVRHRLRCALGTAFDPLTCECSKRVSDTGDCLEVHMDFNNGKVEDSSINRLPIANQNVEVTNKSTPLTGIALFGRDSKLTIWRYQNYDFRDHIMLKVQFRPGPGGDPIQPLISNCDGSQVGPSVAILYDSKLKEVRLILQTDNDTRKELVFPVNADVWNDVTYIYDGQEFIGIVNGVRRYVSRQDPHLLGIIGGEIKSKPTRGLIEIRDGAIVLGHCPQFGYYTGAMVDIQIYTCIPKDFRLE